MDAATVLSKLKSGELTMCVAAGCSNTFAPPGGRANQRYCGRDDCVRNAQPCAAPWCSNTFRRTSGRRYCHEPECDQQRREAKKVIRLRGPAVPVLRQVIAQTGEMPKAGPPDNAMLSAKVRAYADARQNGHSADRVVALTDLAATAVMLAAVEAGAS